MAAVGSSHTYGHRGRRLEQKKHFYCSFVFSSDVGREGLHGTGHEKNDSARYDTSSVIGLGELFMQIFFLVSFHSSDRL